MTKKQGKARKYTHRGQKAENYHHIPTASLKRHFKPTWKEFMYMLRRRHKK